MFSLALRSFNQLLSPEYRPYLWRSLGLTIGVLFLLWLGIEGAVSMLVDYLSLKYASELPAWVDWAISFITGIGAIIGLSYLLAPVCAVVLAFFQDDIALRLERSDYPQDPEGKPQPFNTALAYALRFAAVVLLANILALLLLLVPVVNMFAFFVINGYLLGREFFEFAAMRYMPPEKARQLRKEKSTPVFMGGLIIAVLLSIPILNLFTPLFATLFMLHVFKDMKAKGKIAI
ncbi:sulfate transporter family protein [Polycladidibacter stylochi]|uniref:sulfate transporter family protein n=1 Tax=Polycladidibacter stylochi TaxID=1807766 RepID=UPI00082C0F11|nr:sulfate transporter family protein [Pseudovibrio stylochi]